MVNPTISIIVPVYNAEKYLRQCMDSIVNQTFSDIEIICVNDGSTDNSLEILNEYAQTDNRVRVISQKNSGVSEARNTALEAALGKYIMFVDSDDRIDADTCKIALDAMEEYKTDLVMWDYIIESKGQTKCKNIFTEDVIFDKETVKSRLHRRMIGIINEELRRPETADSLCPVCMKLYKRECIYGSNIRFYDIHEIGTYEDGIFNLNVLEHVDTAVYLNKHLYYYCKNKTNSLTRAYNPMLQMQHERIHGYMRKYIEENNLGEEYGEALNNRIALELLGYGLHIMKLKKGRIAEIKKIISNPTYKNAFKQLKFEYLPLHWKAFYGCAKYNFASGVFVLLFCIKKLRGR